MTLGVASTFDAAGGPGDPAPFEQPSKHAGRGRD